MLRTRNHEVWVPAQGDHIICPFFDEHIIMPKKLFKFVEALFITELLKACVNYMHIEMTAEKNLNTSTEQYNNSI